MAPRERFPHDPDFILWLLTATLYAMTVDVNLTLNQTVEGSIPSANQAASLLNMDTNSKPFNR